MQTSFKYTLLLFSVFCTTVLFSQTTLLNLANGWKFRKISEPGRYYPAIVPGSIYSDLFNNKLIPDPYFRDNETKLQWIEKEEWEYTDSFNLTAEQYSNSHIEIIFEGLDTRCDVFINDKMMASPSDMFYPLVLDCKEIFKKGLNVIRIHFFSQADYATQLYQKNKYPLPDDARVMLRKAQYRWGWDWGPRFVGCGICKPVSLRFWNNARIESIHFTQGKISEKEADIHTDIVILSDHDTELITDISSYHFEVLKNSNDSFVIDQNFIGKTTKLLKGLNKIHLDFKIKDPVLWWTNGLGKPNLYELVVFLKSSSVILDEKLHSIGLRTIELVRVKDSIGKSFYFKLNGVPLFIKGANYIPSEAFEGLIDQHWRKYQLLQTAAKRQLNMLRIWGGGSYEDDFFYTACDKAGILVWQDFMFACAMYPGDSSFLNDVKNEADFQVKRLANHPCLALWCGNNEIDEGWNNWGWQDKYKYSKQDSTEIRHNYLKIFDSILPQSVHNNDSLTAYIPSSPQIGWGHPESMKEGDSHYWGVWWGEEPFEMYKEKVPRFMSEYGFQAIPAYQTILKFTCDTDRNLHSTVMKAHQKHPRGFELIDKYMNCYYKPPKDFTSYIYVSQLLQSYGMGMAIEAQRSAKPCCMGTLYWQLNDCWPVVSWSGIDYYGTEKAFNYHLKQLYANFLLSGNIEKGSLNVYVVSDSMKTIKAELKLRLLDFHGHVLWKLYKNIEIGSNTSGLYFSQDTSVFLKNKDRNAVVLEMELWNGKIKLNSGFYYFAPPKALSLEAPNIDFRIVRDKKYKNDKYLEIKSANLARNVYIWSDIPNVVFADNYFDLPAGKTVTIPINAEKCDAAFLRKSIHIISLYDTY